MKVVAFIEPPQEAVIEKILRHCGLWQEPTRAPPARTGFTEDPEAVPETVCVPIDTFLAEL